MSLLPHGGRQGASTPWREFQQECSDLVCSVECFLQQSADLVGSGAPFRLLLLLAKEQPSIHILCACVFATTSGLASQTMASCPYMQP